MTSTETITTKKRATELAKRTLGNGHHHAGHEAYVFCPLERSHRVAVYLGFGDYSPAGRERRLRDELVLHLLDEHGAD